jgi:hypothetical protein
MTNPEVIDEYAETQVLTDARRMPPSLDDEASAQSVYSEYVQEIERMLKDGSAK